MSRGGKGTESKEKEYKHVDANSVDGFGVDEPVFIDKLLAHNTLRPRLHRRVSGTSTCNRRTFYYGDLLLLSLRLLRMRYSLAAIIISVSTILARCPEEAGLLGRLLNARIRAFLALVGDEELLPPNLSPCEPRDRPGELLFGNPVRREVRKSGRGLRRRGGKGRKIIDVDRRTHHGDSTGNDIEQACRDAHRGEDSCQKWNNDGAARPERVVGQEFVDEDGFIDPEAAMKT
ncbi:hypothetical protein SCP_1303810 [Sparassis crispa]|uniref:Uncharacterized protein n=1 Tax=Sparassis crispa TaxID=139825 RepID=A0A401H2B9_9APHY|nr:hypothetical protein SCP_1303810 [Sparassis crispa]GBE88564.1 hypothetical protein SCP_1303810 [Sparassis crispa]